MTPRSYAYALARLGLSPYGAAVLLGVAPVCSFAWVVGAAPVPLACTRLLRACVRDPALLREFLA